MENKKLLFILVIIFLIVFFMIYITKSQTKETNELNSENRETYVDLGKRTKQNISKKLKEEREFDGLILQNANIIYSNEIFTFSVTLINKNNTDYTSKDVLLNLLNDKKKVTNTIRITIPDLSSNETTTLNITTEKDIIDAYDYSFEK